MGYIYIYILTHAVRAVPPSKPIIRDGATRNVWGIEEPYNEGSDVNLICEVRGGKPLPKLTWYLDNTVIDESYHYNAESGLTVNHLVYAKIGRQHLKARLICQASNTNLISPQTRLLILNVNRKSSTILALYFSMCDLDDCAPLTSTLARPNFARRLSAAFVSALTQHSVILICNVMTARHLLFTMTRINRKQPRLEK